MASNDDLTTLVCLFHHQDQAQAAINDLLAAGVPESSITLQGGAGSSTPFESSSLASLGVPERDLQHLNDGVRDGGSIVAVRATEGYAEKVEDIFDKHHADLIDETGDDREGFAGAGLAGAGLAGAGLAGETAAGERAIPVVEENLVVGKRTVEQGGVRVYKRVVEIPVEESVNLREEHINIERKAVDRPVAEGDYAFGERSIELTETAEEAVVGKSARVVEEVVVGKDASTRTEQIRDTVRHTEVEVEEIAPGTRTDATRRDL